MAIKPSLRLWLALALVLVSVAGYLLANRVVGWQLTWQFRQDKLLTMLLVATCASVSTVVFQTITFNRILTPSVMGFDALYMLVQALLVAALGGLAFASLDGHLKWLAEIALMVGLVSGLFRWLFLGQRRDLLLMILVGIVLGILFRSATGLVMRILEPTEFNQVLDASFASFNQVDDQLLLASYLLCALPLWLLWQARNEFDVMLLGRDQATNLGVNYHRQVSKTLICVAVLVAVPTALVGPMMFFGLLVANLAYHLAGSHQHGYVLLMSVLLAMICLVGGQAILEHVFNFGSALAIIIEFIGGIVFILLVMQRGKS